jgi:hypothetical protein
VTDKEALQKIPVWDFMPDRWEVPLGWNDVVNDAKEALAHVEHRLAEPPAPMEPERKEMRKLKEKRNDVRQWLSQWVRILKHSGAYLWDERDSAALEYLHNCLILAAPPKKVSPITDVDEAELLTDLLGNEGIHEGFVILEAWLKDHGIEVEED